MCMRGRLRVALTDRRLEKKRPRGHRHRLRVRPISLAPGPTVSPVTCELCHVGRYSGWPGASRAGHTQGGQMGLRKSGARQDW